MKTEIVNFRNEIAKLEAEQKNVKEQRKTERFTGTRTMQPWQAQVCVQENKDKLRLMYAAYGLMRGKKFNEIENQAKPIDRDSFYTETGIWVNEKYVGLHPLTVCAERINQYLKKYGYTMPEENNAVIIERCEEVICISE